MRSGRRPSVLVVEDELLIAMELEASLERCGCSVLGPAPTVQLALTVLKGERPDGAILDVNLRGERVTPVATELRSLDVPFVLVTAFDPAGLDEPALQSAPVLRKPITGDEVWQALQTVL